MAYATYDFYLSEYLVGMEPTVPEEKFAFFEKQACIEIDARTHGRIKYLKAVPEDVKMCACAIAEHLYKAYAVTSAATSAGLAGVLTSYSNDGESGTVDASSAYTEAGSKAHVTRLVRKYMLNTGLLYGGVRVAES